MFQGSFVAIVTPFSNGEVDYKELGELIEFQIKNGTSGIVPCGTTGESATLSEKEHAEVIRFCIEKVNKRVPVIAGTGSNSTATTIKLTKEAQEMGADGALVITPYYNKPTQEGLYLHYKAVAEATEIPIVLYNVPGRTGVNMLPDTVVKLALEFDNVIGLKDATGSLTQASAVLGKIGDKREFDLFSGEDAIVLPLIAIGAKGVISVIANIAPKSMSDLVKNSLEGNLDVAKIIHHRQLSMCDALFCETNPVPVKAALEIMGKIGGDLRLPLSRISASGKERLQNEMKTFGLI